MKNKYIKSLGGEEEEVLGSKGRIVSTEESAKDEWQTTLRPQHLDDYIGQEAFKKNLKVYMRQQSRAKSRWIMCCSMDRRDSARPPWRRSSPMSWDRSLK